MIIDTSHLNEAGFFDILRSRGMRENELEKIAFGNFHRIVKEIVK